MNNLKKFEELINEGKLVSTLDNGGMPFTLDIDDKFKTVSVFKQAHRYLSPKEVFTGKVGKKGDANSAYLLRIGDDKYVFIGSEIYEFESPEKVLQFYAPIGNSMVPYPIALTKDFVIFMLDKVYVPKSEFPKDTKWDEYYGEFYKTIEDSKKKKLKALKKKEGRVLMEGKKNIVHFDNFLKESLINIDEELAYEIEDLERKMCEHDECERVDNGYIEIKTPFELNPDSKNPDWVNKVGMVFYPELLSYADQKTPWIACRIELEGKKDQDMVRDLLKYIIGLLEKSGYKPFMDEDAFCNHWNEDERPEWTNYKCYVNPSYPDGYWENHCLE